MFLVKRSNAAGACNGILNISRFVEICLIFETPRAINITYLENMYLTLWDTKGGRHSVGRILPHYITHPCSRNGAYPFLLQMPLSETLLEN